MKAMLLNSGIGSRLRPFTDGNPKCLVPLNDSDTILSHEIDILIAHGVTEIIVTTGPFEDTIKNYITDKYPDLKVTYVLNDRYSETNYIYSMHKARDLIDDDFILMHGDMVFDPKLMKLLLDSEHKTCVLVHDSLEVPEKDFKGRIADGRIKEIGVNVFGDDARFIPPVYKIAQEDFKQWLEKIAEFIEAGNDKVYAENAFNEISDDLELYPVYYKDEFCMEIDDNDDLAIAKEKYFSKA